MKKTMLKMACLLAVPAMLASWGIATRALGADLSADAAPKMSSEQLRIAVQGICPVSGQKLGAHGKPVKTKIGQEEVFLCCEGCLGAKPNKEHWDTIHASLAKAQGKCPVMGKTLPAKPASILVEGRIVYVCCPPCTKKIEADPKAYLRKVDELYLASIEARQKTTR
ncbi:MAG: hypothetical protein ACYC6Y_06470 [Thermoguttaceae bacterium]